MRSYLYNLATDRYSGLIPSLLKGFLYALSLVYGLIIRLLMFIYHIKPYRANCKVISVGNITLGGTGKTSLVEYIAGYLEHNGHKIAIVTRGYKRKIIPNAVIQGSYPSGSRRNAEAKTTFGTSYETMGDEPYMLQENLKDIAIIVGADRIRGINRAVCDYGVDTVILDDGFQQWKIKKDLDIVTIDAGNPFGNRKMLPRGILRQPLSSLREADIFVITKTNINPQVREIKNFLARINPVALIIESIHNPVGFYQLGEKNNLLRLDALKEKTVTLISGIADPVSFEDLITDLGIKIGLSLRFADHYNYSQTDIENVIRESQKKNIDTIVTTGKDAVKLYELRVTSYELRILVLRIELQVTENEEKFLDRLSKLYSI